MYNVQRDGTSIHSYMNKSKKYMHRFVFTPPLRMQVCATLIDRQPIFLSIVSCLSSRLFKMTPTALPSWPLVCLNTANETTTIEATEGKNVVIGKCCDGLATVRSKALATFGIHCCKARIANDMLLFMVHINCSRIT